MDGVAFWQMLVAHLTELAWFKRLVEMEVFCCVGQTNKSTIEFILVWTIETSTGLQGMRHKEENT